MGVNCYHLHRDWNDIDLSDWWNMRAVGIARHTCLVAREPSTKLNL